MCKIIDIFTEKLRNEFQFVWERVKMKSVKEMKLCEKNEKFAVKHINALFCGSYLLVIVLALFLIAHISQSPRYDLETFLKFELARHERVKRDEQPKGWVGSSWKFNLFISWLYERKIRSDTSERIRRKVFTRKCDYYIFRFANFKAIPTLNFCFPSTKTFLQRNETFSTARRVVRAKRWIDISGVMDFSSFVFNVQNAGGVICFFFCSRFSDCLKFLLNPHQFRFMRISNSHIVLCHCVRRE